MDKGNYKWSYDPRDESLNIWPVDSAEKAARPMHMDVTGDDGYAYCSQGRLTVDENGARGVIYESRPYLGDEDDVQAQAMIRLASEHNSIKWRTES